jgi:hypothetical protein
MMKIVVAAAVLSAVASLSGCAYGGVATTGDKVVITKNDSFLFGIMRQVYVCKVGDSGVTNCKTAESP